MSDNYINASSKLITRCENGHIHEVSWNKFQSGHRCVVCQESKGEKKIRNYLELNNVNFTPQYRFEKCKDKYTLPFDFYLIDYNIVIEYDGEGHYKDIYGNLTDRQNKDNIKTNYCKENNIKLIRIPYWEFENIEKILNEKIKE